MFSQKYYDIIERVKVFHLNNKSYSGGGTLAYAEEIKNLAKKHNAKSLLDYGCGKGLQYVEGSLITFGESNQTFDQYIGVDNVFKYDPCVVGFMELPKAGIKFDAVIAIQSLTAVPDADMPIVVNQLMSMTNKFCFVGNNTKPGKSKKKGDPDEHLYFQGDRCDPEWWKYQFRNWTGSEIILKFINN